MKKTVREWNCSVTGRGVKTAKKKTRSSISDDFGDCLGWTGVTGTLFWNWDASKTYLVDQVLGQQRCKKEFQNHTDKNRKRDPATRSHLTVISATVGCQVNSDQLKTIHACLTVSGTEMSMFWSVSVEVWLAALWSLNYNPSGTGGLAPTQASQIRRSKRVRIPAWEIINNKSKTDHTKY